MDAKRKNVYIWSGVVVFLLLFVAGIAAWGNQRAGLRPEVVLENVPYDVRVFVNPRQPGVGDTIHVRMEVRLNGQLTSLEDDYVLTHATVVSKNAADIAFYHATESLPQTSTGVYEFTHTLQEPTNYVMWIEMNDNKSRDHHGEQSDYIGYVSLTVNGAQEDAPLTPASKEFVFGQYRVRLLNETITAGEQLRLKVETLDGEAVRLMEDFDHYYVVASPREMFYVLDHPDHERSTSSEIFTKPVVFPAVGQYAFWIRIFVAGEDNTFEDFLNGAFVVEVTASE